MASFATRVRFTFVRFAARLQDTHRCGHFDEFEKATVRLQDRASPGSGRVPLHSRSSTSPQGWKALVKRGLYKQLGGLEVSSRYKYERRRKN
ncbi:hypothetical protein C6P46_006686 [Rhodotorula mucilaginosa]|uniref:Uncharacterized protein n=1 Tax=Rhodotorula mucilaginosa TaxID=5537 RepID=A0A9P7B3I1_RHOMI|nr:hypothetical protein C6P46_006686 [Rhodotorula mucilaginosa]